MKVKELRQKYLDFFESKDHHRFPSGSLVPYDVTGRLDESLLFTGAGMIQFKPYFRGAAQPEQRRLMTAQKCVRTGDIDEVGDATHLTFFEMMGNFSFGDYFKKEAVAYSWEFLTSPEWLGLDPKRLSFTIFEDDDEAYELWAEKLSSVEIDPAARIFRLDEETNYWPAGAFSNGPPGPCGPNSEMFYWTSKEPPPSGPYTREQFLLDDAVDNWVEIWNDVFILYEWQGRLKNPSRPAEGYVKEGMPGLPFRSIDTGMGLERTAMVLGGYKSVYESDVFEPILATIRDQTVIAKNSLAAAVASRTIQIPGLDPRSLEIEARVILESSAGLAAIKIIADHTRTASFCIADGVFPSNNGRGYVLRRLIRRAVLKGQRTLGIQTSFMAQVFEGVLAAMGDFYMELNERKETIIETLTNEEAQFRRTLASGSTLLEEELRILSSGSTLDGATAFRLYDTFGFPLEVTREIAEERGVNVDELGYEEAMREAQERSRAGQERESVYGGLSVQDEIAVDGPPAATDFEGYLATSVDRAKVVRIKPGGPGKLKIALDRTPFYAESGGQVGDHGKLIGGGFDLDVLDTTKAAGTFWHEIRWAGNPDGLLGKQVEADVDEVRRNRIRRNHTATHLLHAALRSILGNHVAQAGSYVGPDNLRFDFSHRQAMTAGEIATVERIVNEQILANSAVVTYADIPIDEARAKGAMALFGEKYGDKVRMVEIGSFSRELCGGIHVTTTGEIGLFKILSESSAASGIRRIEAISGEASYEWVLAEVATIRDAANLLGTTPGDLVQVVARTANQLRDEKKRREKAELQSARGGGSTGQTLDISGIELWTRDFGDVDPKIASSELDNAAAQKPLFVGVVAASSAGKVSLFVKAGPEAVNRGAHAGNLVREVAKTVGGGGGGRPDFATAGGKEPEKVAEALKSAGDLLRAMLK